MKTTPTTIKLDEQIKMKIKLEAKKDGRTLHGYIINLLKKNLETKN